MGSQEAVAPRLFNIKQAAAYLGVAVWTLRDLEWRGELPAIRNLGRRLLFDIKDLDRLVDQHKGGTQ